MTRTTRLAAAMIAAALACALLFVGATSAPAAGPAIESYQAQGEARGLDLSFTFSGSIFERLLDLGMPEAKSTVSSEGGGASRGAAAQVFPGDLVVGAAGEQIPGYRQAVYPREKAEDAPDDSHVSDTFRMPGIINAGPLTVDTGHIKTTATETRGSGAATTNLVSLGMGAPLITVGSLASNSVSSRSTDHVDHVAETVAHDITILITPQLIVKIGTLAALAHTTSDGAAPTAETSLKLYNVSALMNGSTYKATIDQDGLRLVGAPQVPLPSPLSGGLIPDGVPQDANQTLGVILKNAGVQIFAAQATKSLDDISSDASLSGLLVMFTGTVPNVFVPDIVAQLVYEDIVPKLPEDVQARLRKSICYEQDIKPLLPKQIVENPSFPDLPLCFSPQVVPGPGSGVVTTFSIGKVRSQSVAVQGVTFTEPPVGGGFTDGGFLPPPVGPQFGGGFPPGTDVPQTGTGSGTTPTRLTGLVARLPSAALYGAGLGFFVLAMALTFGPSLRRWRATPEL
jgi:hypothetical protein